MEKNIIFIVLMSALIVSCNNETFTAKENGDGYFINIEGFQDSKDILSRNYWDSDENENLRFFWEDSSGDMKSFVFDNESSLDFIDGRKYSDAKITADKEVRNKCNIQLVSGLASDFKDGYTIWSISPVKEENIESEKEVSLSLPKYFVYDISQKNITEHLRDFIYLSGTGVVSEGRSVINFDVLPSILRFRIINKENETLSINSIGFSGPFNNKGIATYNITGNNVSYDYYSEMGSYDIRVNCSKTVSADANKDVVLYALTFPTKMSDEDITLNIDCNYGQFMATTSYSNIFNNDGFKSNTYYTLSIPVSRQKIEIENIEVSDFIIGDNSTIMFDK